jgi:hypothetical protein
MFVFSVLGDLLTDYLFLLPFLVFFLLGVALIVFTELEKIGGLLRAFFLLTGASAVGVFASIVLHNAIYGLFSYFFGANFWAGGDEPVFFIMAIIVCPLGFLVGAIGSIVLGIKSRCQS